MNCRFMVATFEQLEAGICFGVRKNYFYMLIFTLVFNLLLLFLSFFIFCSTLGEPPKDNKVKNFDLKIGNAEEVKKLAKKK